MQARSNPSGESRPIATQPDVPTIKALPWDEGGSFALTEEVGRELFENAPNAMVISNGDGCIVGVNAQTERMFGYRREELIGQKVEKLVPKSLRESRQQQRADYLVRVGRRPLGNGIEMWGLRKDGSEVPVEISLKPLETAKTVLVFSIIQDRSERLAAQRSERQVEFEKAISGLSARFINLPANRVDQEIENGLKVLCEALDADRATLGMIDPVSGDMLIAHTWARPGFPEFGERILRGMLPWLEERIRNAEITSLNQPDDLPPEAHIERQYMESIGEKSALIVPFCVGGKVVGGMSTDTFRKQKEWHPELISRVQDVADIFANALMRKQADESLQRAYAEIHELKEQFERENSYLREEIKLEHSHVEVIGNSAAIRGVLRKVEQVASTDSAVLILGETGTGKELIASTIHGMSNRKSRPMVKINCAALPATLIESELFGREKGAYTGSLAREIGRFELADQSTIFLDEIGELPTEVQSKLLRVLQEGQFERLGSSKTIQVNVRIIAASNRDLQAMVREGRFREDLFYRLNVFPILIPPLRERREDIPTLVWHILKDLGKRMGRTVEGVHAATMRKAQKYSWPGNVRELRNVLERGLILHAGSMFRAEIPELETRRNPGGRRLSEIESEYLQRVLQDTHWRIRGRDGAADILGLKPTTLEAKMKKLGIRRPN